MKYFLYSLIFCWLSTALHSQPLLNFSSQEGLSNRRIFSIQKDKNGYIWFLNASGIARYNGYEIQNYLLKENNKQIIHPVINQYTLQTDTSHRVWVLGLDGHIFRYNTCENKFNPLPAFLGEEKYTDMYIDSSNRLWMFQDYKVFVYDITNHKPHSIKNNTGISFSCFTERAKDDFYMVNDDALYRIHGNTLQLKIQKQCEIGKDFFKPCCICYFPNQHCLLIGTEKSGLFLFDEKSRKLYTYAHPFKDLRISCISNLHDQTALIATDDDGLYRFDLTKRSYTPFLKPELGNDSFIPGNNIKDILIDTVLNRIWLATYPQGVTLYRKGFPDFKRYEQIPNNPQSLINSQVNQVIEDSDGDYWFATDNGISLFCNKDQRWHHLLTRKDIHPSTTFLSIAEVEPGIILAGGTAAGIYYIKKADLTYRLLKTDEYITTIKEAINMARAIICTPDHTICIGGENFLRIGRLGDKRLDTYPAPAPITVLLPSKEGLWVGTQRGLYAFNRITGKYTLIRMKGPKDYITALYQKEPDHHLLVGTNGNGLLSYDPDSKQCRRLDSGFKNPSDDYIYYINADHWGNPIYATDNSIIRYDCKLKQFHHWTKAMGLNNCSFNLNSGCLTRHNTILLGTGNGAIEFSTLFHIPQNRAGNLILDNLSIQYQNVYDSPTWCNVIQDQSNLEKLYLKHTENTFSIRVTSVNCENPALIMYSWYMKGHDDHWSTPDKERIIHYGNIPSGNYTLFIKAIDGSSMKVVGLRKLNIVIGRSVWISNLAQFGYLILFLLIALAIYYFAILLQKKKTANLKLAHINQWLSDLKSSLSLIEVPLESISETHLPSQKNDLDILHRHTSQMRKDLDQLMKGTAERPTDILDSSPCDSNERNTTDNRSENLLLICSTHKDLRDSLRSLLSIHHQVIDDVAPDQLINRIEKGDKANLILLECSTSPTETRQDLNCLKRSVPTQYIPILAITNSREDILLCLNHEVDAYIEQPIDPGILKQTIFCLLARQKSISRRYSYIMPEVQCQSQDSKDIHFILRVKDYIEQHLSEKDFNIDTLSLAFNMSRTNFFSKIKELTGTAPIQLIYSIRMKQAAHMLRDLKMNVSDTAEAVGFSDIKYFRNVFKKHFGITPSEYANNKDYL